MLEDLQWCDQATLEWLPFFLRWAAPAPVVLCSTLRIEELQEQPGVTRLLAALRRDGIVEELELGPLDTAETGALASHVAGRTLESTVVADLYRETEGNALYIVETVRGGQKDTLPPTIQAAIGARLAQLSPAARELVHQPERVRPFAAEALALASATHMPEYVGAARGHLAWLALRAGDTIEAAEQARAALDAWQRMPTVYPFLWTALWPLVELAALRGDIEEVIVHARVMLDEKQALLPEALTTELEAVIHAWAAGNATLARRELDAALALARQAGYL